ncbi:MAG: hypothetical protein ACTHYC_07665 [Sphingobacterium sp.]
MSPRKKGNGFIVWVTRSGENGQALDVPGLTVRYILQRKRGARRGSTLFNNGVFGAKESDYRVAEG